MDINWVSSATNLESDIFILLFQKELIPVDSIPIGKSELYPKGLFTVLSKQQIFVEVDESFSKKIKELSKDENFVKMVKDGRDAQVEKWIMQDENYPIEKIQLNIHKEKENAAKIAALLELSYEYYEELQM